MCCCFKNEWWAGEDLLDQPAVLDRAAAGKVREFGQAGTGCDVSRSEILACSQLLLLLQPYSRTAKCIALNLHEAQRYWKHRVGPVSLRSTTNLWVFTSKLKTFIGMHTYWWTVLKAGVLGKYKKAAGKIHAIATIWLNVPTYSPWAWKWPHRPSCKQKSQWLSREAEETSKESGLQRNWRQGWWIWGNAAEWGGSVSDHKEKKGASYGRRLGEFDNSAVTCLQAFQHLMLIASVPPAISYLGLIPVHSSIHQNIFQADLHLTYAGPPTKQSNLCLLDD